MRRERLVDCIENILDVNKNAYQMIMILIYMSSALVNRGALT